ncbi:MAG: CRISPR-associated helicase Cas3' [Bacillota bacterium]
MAILYSHPGKKLKDHLYNVYRLGMDKFENKNLNFSNLKEIKSVAEIVLLTHDFGKATDFFQNKLKLAEQNKQESEEYQKLTKQGYNKSSHSLLSALFTYYILDEIIENDLLSLIGLTAVYRHHSNLKDFRDMMRVNNWELLEEQFAAVDLEKLDEILALVNTKVKLKELKFEELKTKLDSRQFRRKMRKLKRDLTEEKNYLLSNFVYSLLISSDKAEAIFYNKNLSYSRLQDLVLENQILDDTIVEKYKQQKGWDNAETKINQTRNKIYDEVITNIANLDLKEDRILSLNVPTGTGKTLTALAAGLKLRSRLQQHKLIYALPFTSIIDQNHNVFIDVFEKTGHTVDSSLLIKHHYLTPKKYIKDDDYEDEDYDISKHLIESWNSEIVVTTFVQLLHSIFSNQNRSLIKFNNIANSIILLDEVQNIPHKYWELIRVVLKTMAEKLDCYFVFITATMPLIYSEKDNEIKELAASKEEYFKFFNRYQLDLSEFRESKTIVEFKEFLVEELKTYKKENFLIILNTIQTSIEVYEKIQELIDRGELQGEAIYLSTNIIPQAREKRINQIGDSKERQIVISTQMVEAGVDIDLDRVYRDFAPLDSINQTCGRCNRNFNASKQGRVTLVKLINPDHNGNTYASYIYSDILLTSTQKILNEYSDIVEEKEFLKLNQRYFSQLNGVKSDDISEQLLEKIQSLKYEKAFWKDDSNLGETFALIEQDFATVNLFIEINEEAQEVWNRYEEINAIEINNMNDYSKRKEKFENIKKQFLNYVITVPEYVAKEQLEESELQDTFNRIDRWQCDSVYNLQTGFKRKEEEVNTFF